MNAFHAAGGMAFVVRQLLDAGLAHEDVVTVAGEGLRHYQREPFLEDGAAGLARRARPRAWRRDILQARRRSVRRRGRHPHADRARSAAR